MDLPSFTRSPIVLWVFAGWTLFVWGGRLRNLAADPGGLTGSGALTLVGAVGFTTLGLILLGLLITRQQGELLRWSVAALAALTTVVWLIRGVDIALGDHSVGFIVVHVVLAIVSIALAVVSWSVGRIPSRPWVSQ